MCVYYNNILYYFCALSLSLSLSFLQTQGSSVSAGDKTVLVVQAIESQTHLSSPEIPVR